MRMLSKEEELSPSWTPFQIIIVHYHLIAGLTITVFKSFSSLYSGREGGLNVFFLSLVKYS